MKVQFDFSSGRIAMEGDGPEPLKILQAARELAPHVTQIQITSTAPETPPPTSEVPQRWSSSPSMGDGPGSMTMRQFARSLTLDNASERIAALAYYANKIDGKPSFSPKDMDGWLRCAVFKNRPKWLWPCSTPSESMDTRRVSAEGVGGSQIRAKI